MPPILTCDHRYPDHRRFLILAGAIATILMLSFFSQLPTIADWSQFAFWDPGTTLKGDLLLSLGMKPGIDFGYTHGLASLEIARWGFALLGRTPAAFLIMTAVMEILMAIALARLAVALRLSREGIIFLLIALPIAIMPRYVTLTHPLEALLLLWALSQQASGLRPQALAICTACLFVKPSMAYLYGLILLIWTIRELLLSREQIFARLVSQTWLAILTALLMAAALAWRFGVHSLLLTVFPTTGVRTYQAFSFGFLSSGLLQFLFPDYHPWFYYLVTPAGIWIIMSLICAVGMLVAVVLLLRRRKISAIIDPIGTWSQSDHRVETILSIGVMHLIFILGFYGWKDAWQYYSYLPVLFTAVFISNLGFFSLRVYLSASNIQPRVETRGLSAGFPPRAILTGRRLRFAAALSFLALASQTSNIQAAWNGWSTKVRTQQTGYLWADKDQLAQWNKILAKIDNKPTLSFTFGYLPWMPPGMSMPLGWYPVEGLGTPLEIARLQSEILNSQYVIIWNAFRPHDPWDNSEFAKIRGKFTLVLKTQDFSLWHQSNE
ncbi:MAG TPA: hypothetical protein VMG59_13410 [Phycisphaerae bacterium]|nr:hypothetical protein [Phycisphaerae bacterium]